jgi:type IV secretion system protein TrbL
MKNIRLLVVVSVLFCMCGPTFAAEFDLGQVLDKYQSVSQQFGVAIASAAKKLAFLLFTIDLAWMLISKLIKSADSVELLTAAAMRVIWLGFLLFLMNAQVLTSVIDGFRQLGKESSGLSVFSPGDVFLQGVDLVNTITTRFAANANIMGVPVPAGVIAMTNPLIAITLGLAIIIIILAYLMMTAQYVAIMLQMYFYLACYPIVLAMGATKFGNDMSMKAISAAIVLGVRFLAMYFVMNVASSMAEIMGEQLAEMSVTNLSPLWTVLGMAGLLAFLAMKIPQMASDLLSGTASVSGGDMVATAAMAGAGVGAVAGGAIGAAKAVGGAANSVAGAIKAGSSALAQSKASGASGFGAVSGAAGAIGSGLASAAGDAIKGLGSQSSGGSLASRIDTKTAGMQESKAAGVPAPSVPGGGGSAGSTNSQPLPPAPSASTAPAASPSAPAPSAPAPSAPEAPAASGGGQGSANSQPSAPSISAPSLSAPTSTANSQPPAPSSSGSQAGERLINELKTADSAQGAGVQISGPAHE